MTAPAEAIPNVGVDDPEHVLAPLVTRLLGDLLDHPLAPVEDVARVLDLGRTATFDACARGDLPSVRIGRRVLIPVPALVRWLLTGATGDAVTGEGPR